MWLIWVKPSNRGEGEEGRRLSGGWKVATPAAGGVPEHHAPGEGGGWRRGRGAVVRGGCRGGSQGRHGDGSGVGRRMTAAGYFVTTEGVGGGVRRARVQHAHLEEGGLAMGRFGPARLSWAGSPRRRRKIEEKEKGIGPIGRKNGVSARWKKRKKSNLNT
uniref:Uncharacterized protein n=1 Tax=Oryza sativa subsp. japonica TaxID=39947 RepID=Q6Z427_ORYSJ|nr:hypothetical protein [Oryza sativa Japonica Group]